jgi:mono/diheme cytochrome c family protein
MKYLLKLFVILFLSFGLFGFYYDDQAEVANANLQDQSKEIEVPADVQAVLDRSCLPCHGADGSGKARMKWSYDKMAEYSSTKLISKMVKVGEKVEEEKMPPPKTIKKNPDRKLSEDDKKLLISWADKVAESSMGSGGE